MIFKGCWLMRVKTLKESLHINSSRAQSGIMRLGQNIRTLSWQLWRSSTRLNSISVRGGFGRSLGTRECFLEKSGNGRIFFLSSAFGCAHQRSWVGYGVQLESHFWHIQWSNVDEWCWYTDDRRSSVQYHYINYELSGENFFRECGLLEFGRRMIECLCMNLLFSST